MWHGQNVLYTLINLDREITGIYHLIIAFTFISKWTSMKSVLEKYWLSSFLVSLWIELQVRIINLKNGVRPIASKRDQTSVSVCLWSYVSPVHSQKYGCSAGKNTVKLSWTLNRNCPLTRHEGNRFLSDKNTVILCNELKKRFGEMNL